jgi:hypothetical protein
MPNHSFNRTRRFLRFGKIGVRLELSRLRRFTLRTRRKVDAQWKLFALVHNVQKLQGKVP